MTILNPLRMAILKLTMCVLCGVSFAAAQNITGTVTNGTTGKLAAGDQVELLSLSAGHAGDRRCEERCAGAFPRFPRLGDPQVPHMVRVTHEDVSYFPEGGPLTPGSTTADLTVYDSAKKVDGLSQTVESVPPLLHAAFSSIMRHFMRSPMVAAATYRSQRQGHLRSCAAGERRGRVGAGARSRRPADRDCDEPGFRERPIPLDLSAAPGETQFQIAFHMPYSGEASDAPKPLRDVQHFVVMTPKSMSFEAKNTQSFQQMQDAFRRPSWWRRM